MEHVSFENVDITGGFWKNRQDINRNTTIHAIEEQFRKTGRFDSFALGWKKGDPNQPHIFWDSDIAKWVESVSYIIAKHPDKELENKIEEVIDHIEKNQDESGYFNVYISVCEPENRFKNREYHELYCAGHLIEAAIAYYNATKKDRFLNLMRKYADYIETAFAKDDITGFVTDGHEEIELALVKLWHCTGERRYLELSEFFIDQRGQNEKDVTQMENSGFVWKPSYYQSHLPVREQFTAEGHCVRACYLYTAMADLAREYNDGELLYACKRIFDDIANGKMYITGGIGPSCNGETFTIPYDLPNQTSYAETCAAISLVFFSQRMLSLEIDSKYSDVIERVLYNGFLSGISLDGKSFFYENPLEIHPDLGRKDRSVKEGYHTHYPAAKRAEVFLCSCCPPNVTRLIATLGNYIYSVKDEVCFVHQFIDSNMEQNGVTVTQTTEYPNNGKVVIKASGAKQIAVRIPGWCSSYRIDREYSVKNGYACVDNDGCDITVEFDMQPVLFQASHLVCENSGKAALCMGPVVYCVEGVDNGDLLWNIRISKDFKAEAVYDPRFGAKTITADGFRQDKTTKAYSPLSDTFDKIKLKFIPYFAFANRGESEMAVFMRIKD